MRKRILSLAMAILCTVAAFGQQNWQGNAAIARSGELSGTGLVAASNAFAENTTIIVRNAQSGQSVEVTVIQRIENGGNIFLLLSEEAGREIGMSGSQVTRVQASVISALGTDLSQSLREQAYSDDPDLNPALSVAEDQLLASPEAEPAAAVAEEEPQVAAAAAEEEQPQEEPQPEEQPEEAEAEEPVEPEEPQPAAEAAPDNEPEASPRVTQIETPPTPEATAEEQRLQELSDRIPQKQLYMPPRQQEVYALAPEPAEEEPAEEEAAAAEAEVPEVPEVAQVEEQEPLEEEEEERPPQVSMPGPEAEDEPLEVALDSPQTEEPETPSPEGTRLPAPEQERPLAVTPEEPEAEIEEEPRIAAAAEQRPQPAGEAATLSADLPARTYFVQLGAYSARSTAEKLAGQFTDTYSVTVLPASSGGRRFYKVLVGPLNVDESGTLLYQFRSRGFKDAFIQYVE